MAKLAEEQATLSHYVWNDGERWRRMGVAMSLFRVRQRVWGDIRRYQLWREDGAEFEHEWQRYMPVTPAEWRAKWREEWSAEWKLTVTNSVTNRQLTCSDAGNAPSTKWSPGVMTGHLRHVLSSVQRAQAAWN